MNSVIHANPIGKSQAGFFTGALSVFTALRAGERPMALLLSVNIFILLASYYVLKIVREDLILSEHSAEVKSYASAGQALLLLVLIPAYSFMATRLNRSRLMMCSGLLFASHLAAFWWLGRTGFHVSVPFYLWLGIVNVLLISQFWALANDLNDSESGHRVFPVVGIGSALGAWLGALAAKALYGMLTSYEMMLAAAGGLLLYTLLSLRIASQHQARATEPIGGKSAFQLLHSDRYLRLIAVMVLLLNLVNSLGEFMMAKVVTASLAIPGGPPTNAIGAFYAGFYGDVNLLGLLLQLFVVFRVFKHAGVGGALLVLPVLAMGSYGVMAALPVLGVVRSAKVLENSVDYSLQNTARHALFLTTSRETKFKAKVAIDTLFCRCGDVLQAGFVLAGTHYALGLQHYAGLNLLLAGGWLAIIVCIRRERVRLGIAPERPAEESRINYPNAVDENPVPSGA